jgi:hypothetical protein
VQARGNVIVHAAGGPSRCAIVNLSMGGVLLHTGDQRPAVALAEAVAIDIHLDGQDTAWLRTRGRVHRIDPDAFCVTFDDVGAAFEDAVADEVLAEIESELRPRALIVDARHERAARLMAGLRQAGCDVRVAASPLEAIWWLEQSRAHVAIAVVSELASAGSLMSFLRDMHPGVVRAAIGDGPVGIGDGIERVFTDQPDLGDQLRRLVSRVLVRSRSTA